MTVQAEPSPAFLQSWQRAWQGLGARGDGHALMAALLAAYAEPQRRYHTQQHLGECLAAFDARARPLAERPAEVEMALWFHDAVYDLSAHDNEHRSADWARAALSAAGVEEEAVGRVVQLVLATCHAAPAEGRDAQVVVDIDLSILGADTSRFAEYEVQIRQEYAHVPGLIFRMKRRQVLRSFLTRPRIYATAPFHDALEARARHNLVQAL